MNACFFKPRLGALDTSFFLKLLRVSERVCVRRQQWWYGQTASTRIGKRGGPRRKKIRREGGYVLNKWSFCLRTFGGGFFHKKVGQLHELLVPAGGGSRGPVFAVDNNGWDAGCLVPFEHQLGLF